MSLADSYVLALAEINNAQVVSTDHHEFDAVEINESGIKTPSFFKLV